MKFERMVFARCLAALVLVGVGLDVHAQTVTTVAGNGTIIYPGDGSAATSAGLGLPSRVAVDVAGNLYIAEYLSNRVSKVDTHGFITIVAGNGTSGFSGDGGAATSAQLSAPADVGVDAGGNLYIVDGSNHRVRKVNAGGTITTVAGNGANDGGPFGGGYSGDGGPATSAALRRPTGIAVDSAGNIYIADTLNNRVRKVNASGTITTVAGNGTIGSTGDGGPATSGAVAPQGVAVDLQGNLYIAGGNIVRKVGSNGIITTLAGNGTSGYSGDGGAATSALLWGPLGGLVADVVGNLYIADQNNNRVRKVDTNGIITTVVGNGTSGFSGDGGPATSAQLAAPTGVALDAAGNLYINDYGNIRIRKVQSNGIFKSGFEHL